jgi:hypothetical protein
MKKVMVACLLLVGGLIVFLYGCGLFGHQEATSRATTRLTSNSLSVAQGLQAAALKTSGWASNGNWLITPNKISGKILSIVLPIDGTSDDGVVPFGDGRPDIAPADSTLYDFDLSYVTSLTNESMSFKSGFTGGKCSSMILLFGYFDVEFQQGSNTRKVRMVYGDSGSYVRGDKLLFSPSGEAAGYYWFDTTRECFSATRPHSPEVVALVRDFSDPVRPVMHYYMLGAKLRDNTDYDGSKSNSLTLTAATIVGKSTVFSVDFDVQDVVAFTGVTSTAEYESLTEAQLIKKFDMVQNVGRYEDSPLYCSISFEVTGESPTTTTTTHTGTTTSTTL